MKEKKDKKIRIVFGLPTLGVGGIEKQLVNQLQFFDLKRLDFHVITLFNSRFNMEKAPNLYDQASTHATIHKLDFMGAFDLISWFKLFVLLKELKPDIVVTGMFSANAIFRILRIFCGYKAIACEHTTQTDRKIYHRICDYLLGHLSYKIIAVSQGVKDFICKTTKVREDKVEIIYNGVNLDEIEQYRLDNLNRVEEIKKELGFSTNKKIILSVGRLKKAKNHQLLIRAFEVFLPNNPEYLLVLVGNGNERDNLKELVDKKNLNDAVKFMGLRNDVNKFYMISDFFAITSLSEGFALVGIEAMAFGLPVVSTRVAGPMEYVHNGENGYLADLNSVDVSQKMNMIAHLSEAERNTFRGKCYDSTKPFSIQKNVEKYEALFFKATNTKK